jgi:hypothetical protein
MSAAYYIAARKGAEAVSRAARLAAWQKISNETGYLFIRMNRPVAVTRRSQGHSPDSIAPGKSCPSLLVEQYYPLPGVLVDMNNSLCNYDDRLKLRSVVEGEHGGISGTQDGRR